MQLPTPSRKDDIILQIGSQYLRLGLVGQKIPRKSLNTSNIKKIISHPSNSIQNQILMDQLLCSLFFIHLNSSWQNKTLIILTKVYMSRHVLQLVAKIMFKKFKIEKIQLCLSCVTPLYLTGRYSGIVMVGGASSVEIMAVYQGYPLFRSYKCLDIGTSTLNPSLITHLIQMNPQISAQTISKISQSQLSQIRSSSSSIPVKNNNIYTFAYKKYKLKFNQQKINYEYFFGDYENEQENIAYTFLKMLDQVPVQCLIDVCKNVVFAGGMWRIKGMQSYFKKHVKELIDKFDKLKNMEISKHLAFVSWGFNPSEVPFIACSIGASVKNLEHLTLKRSEYQEKGKYVEKVMESYFLSR